MSPASSRSSSDDVNAEFSRLFWKARKEHNQRKDKANPSDPAHKAATLFAESQGWPWAEELLALSMLDRKGEHDATLQRLANLEGVIPNRWMGTYHFIRASALRRKGELDDAIRACRKAIEDPNFDKQGYAWYNLGEALAVKGDSDEAIKAFQRAIDRPEFDATGYAWNNLGIQLSRKGHHGEATKAFIKALEEPNFDKPGYAWSNLGAVYLAMGSRDEAIKAYRKAIEDPTNDLIAKAWTSLAMAYAESGKRKLAEESFNKALASPDTRGVDHARARAGLRLLRSKITPEALSPDDRAIVDKSASAVQTEEIENTIVAAIQAAGDTQYEKYISKPDSSRDDTLSILRGWSSAVTLLEGSERRWRGGGYFLKWRGFGVVIDPGFDFLRNFHDAGYHGREIHAVVVSHNHPDHNSDLKPIDDLRYEIWRRLEGTKGAIPPYVLVWDKDTDAATKFVIEKPKHRCEPVPLTSALKHPVDLHKEHVQKLPFRIRPFKVEHESKGDVPHAMGMVVELLDKRGKATLRLGYTADTAYFEDLHKHLAGCDVLIAHISQPSIEELQDAAKLKEVHLGYRGTARLLKECQPKLALIGEFWAGFTDLRIPLVKGLRLRSGVPAVFPAGLAMHIRLPSLEIECTECGKPTTFAQVKIAPPTDNFGSLAYLCPSCMIG